MNPFENETTRGYFKAFCDTFYDDTRSRAAIFGINPGRFGAGLTGVPFTDPVALSESCGIANNLTQKKEMSSEFVYTVIKWWGGAKKFYRDFFVTAVSPLGFVKDGINHNYYDDTKTFAAVKPFIVKSLSAHCKFPVRRDVAVVLGTGKNLTHFKLLNDELGLFERVVALEHPRYVMQYRRKRVPEYVEKYHRVLADALG